MTGRAEVEEKGTTTASFSESLNGLKYFTTQYLKVMSRSNTSLPQMLRSLQAAGDGQLDLRYTPIVAIEMRELCNHLNRAKTTITHLWLHGCGIDDDCEQRTFFFWWLKL